MKTSIPAWLGSMLLAIFATSVAIADDHMLNGMKIINVDANNTEKVRSFFMLIDSFPKDIFTNSFEIYHLGESNCPHFV